MGRLYYEKQILPVGEKETPVKSENRFNDYLNKVATLIPSEVLAGYLTMIGFVGAITNTHIKVYIAWTIFAVGFILTPIYLNHVADENKPKRNHLILSTVAFIVWAYVTTGKQLLDFFSTSLFDQAIASIILVLFSLISAIIPLNK